MIDQSLHSARALILRYGRNSTSYQILNPEMRHWFSESQDAVAGYVSYRGVRVVAGAPVCSLDRIVDRVDELEADTRTNNEHLLFFGAGTPLAQIYTSRGDYNQVCIGAQPVWDPAQWPMIVKRNASLRAQLNRARNKGVRVVEWTAASASRSEVLRNLLQSWLSTRGLPPLRFMATPQLLDQLEDRRIFVATREDDHSAVGFLLATPVPGRNGWLIELWPRGADAPNGTTHLLVDTAMRAFEHTGSRYATLGLAPLSVRACDATETEPWWLRQTLRWVRAHGRRFYNFEGLESFKASLRPPVWEPIFVIAQGPQFTPRMLHAIAGAFSGGSPVGFIARSLGSAVEQEWRAVVGRVRS